MTKISVSNRALHNAGIETLRRGVSTSVSLPIDTLIEAPASLKWTDFFHSLNLGAFSYQVSGYCFAATIGRYCSFGEDIQIGRQNHPMTWASTSPMFYQHQEAIDVSRGFNGAKEYKEFEFRNSGSTTLVQKTKIGNDVWIGHGAFIRAGVTIGDGAIIAARSVVSKDVPHYAVVAGNPARVKKYRFEQPVIDRLRALRWWRYAPWQFAHLDMANIEAFLDGIEAMVDEPPFQPTVFDVKKWAG